MTLSKGAAGNLINRYRAVLRKCRMMNVFGSLVVAGLLVAGSVGNAGAEKTWTPITSGDHTLVSGAYTITKADAFDIAMSKKAHVTVGDEGKGTLDVTDNACWFIDVYGNSEATTGGGELTVDGNIQLNIPSGGHRFFNYQPINVNDGGAKAIINGGLSIPAFHFAGAPEGSRALDAQLVRVEGMASFSVAGDVNFSGTSLSENTSAVTRAVYAVIIGEWGTPYYKNDVTAHVSLGTDAGNVVAIHDISSKSKKDAEAYALFAQSTNPQIGDTVYTQKAVIDVYGSARFENISAESTGSEESSFAFASAVEAHRSEINLLGDTTIRNISAKVAHGDASQAEAYALTAYDGGVINVNTGEVSADHTVVLAGNVDAQGSVAEKEGTTYSAVTLNLANDKSSYSGDLTTAQGGVVSLSLRDGAKADIGTIATSKEGTEGGTVILNNTERTTLSVGTLAGVEDACLEKRGGGGLVLNGDVSHFGGRFTLGGGSVALTADTGYFSDARVTVSGGTLVAPTLSFNPEQGKLTLDGGTLVTNTGQIFNTALNAQGNNTETGGVKSSVKENLTFNSGLIAFNDVRYNLQYAGSAATALDADYAPEAAETGKKEITFTGDLYTVLDPDPTPGPDPDPTPDPDPDPTPDPDPDPAPDPDPDPAPDPGPDPSPDPTPDPDPLPPAPEPDPQPGPDSIVSVEDLNKEQISNVVFGNTTITTGSEEQGGKNLIVGGSRVDEGGFENADALPGSIGSRNVNLGPQGSGVAIVGGHYLTLVGGAPETSLIEAGADNAKPVDVYVGGRVGGETSTGTLNLGTPAMASGGVLKGNVRIAEGSALNVRAGDHTVTGEAEGTEPGSGISNRGGAVNVAETATLHSSLRQEGGETRVFGTLESSSVELAGGRFDVPGRALVDRLVQHDGETQVSGTVESSSVRAENGEIRIIGTVKTDELASASGVRIAVGDGNTAGRLYAASTTLAGGEAFFDPAWNGDDTLETASHGVLDFRDRIVDGRLGVGRNALLVLGDASADWTLAAFDASGLRWGRDDVSAALSLRSPQRLSATQGAIMVDGSLSEAPVLTPNTATFADRSLLVVDASGLNDGAALSSEGGTLAVAETAGLLLANPTEGDYVITAGFADNAGVRGWDGDYLSTPDRLMALALDKDEAGTVKVRARARDAASVLPGVSVPNILNEMWKSGRNGADSPDMGARFLSRAVNEDWLRPRDAVPVIDGAAQIAVAGGVQGVALAASAAPARAVRDHASLSGAVACRGGEVRGEGLDLWINALYGAERARDFGAGSLDVGYNADFGGVVFGGDAPAGPVRLGVALNAGGGTARSRGDFPSTKNDFDFWGVTLYGSWTRDRLNVVADAGYSEERNEVRQTLPASLRLGQIKADVDAHVLTFGLRGEYLFRTNWADVMPHAGLRYTEATTESFSSRIDGRDVFRVDEDTQRIWSFPVGVTVGKELHTGSGWRVKPRVDLSVVPAAGDAKAHTRVRTPGLAASDGVNARVMDALTFDGSVGIEVEKDNVSFGLNCGVQASEHQRGQSVGVTFSYKF